jgi:hypothetical protein
MAALKNLMLAALTLAISAGISARADAQAVSVRLPLDVTAFVSRRDACSEWSKKAIDSGWNARIEAVYSNLQSLNCFEIMHDERGLRQKYADNAEIMAFLGTGDVTKFVTRLPGRNAVPPASDR